MGDSAENPRFIETLPRHGYRFIATVDHVSADRDHCKGRAPADRHGGRRRLGLLAVAATTVLGVLFALNVGGLRSRFFHPVVPPKIESIAVLPFENLSRDPEQEYFADGMTDELIAELGKTGALRVTSRTSAMQYKGTRKALPEIGRELQVDAVLEAGVLLSGGRVRITANLVYAPAERQLWAQTYERDLGDVLSLQDEVAHDIVRQIRARAAPKRQARVASPVNPEVYRLYLQGKVRGSAVSEGNNRGTIEILKHAIAIDPKFAPAYAALGRAYSDRLFLFEAKKEWETEAEAAIKKALTLDPNLAEAHVSRAALLFTPVQGWQFGQAIEECRRALALNPNLAEAHLLLGVLYFHIGLLDESLHQLQIAGTISPAQPAVAWFTGLSLTFGGRFREALPMLRAASSAPLSKAYQAYDLWQLGRKQEASGLVRELLKNDPEESNVGVATLHTLFMADTGETRKAEKRVREISLKQGEIYRPYGHFHHLATVVADTYAQLNKPRQAVMWLQQAASNGLPCYPCFERDNALDPIRQDPGFVAFMQNMKAQWEYYKSTYGARATAAAATRNQPPPGGSIR